MSRRLLFALVLAVVMVAAAAMAPGAFVFILAIALFIGPFFSWASFVRLHAKVIEDSRTRMPTERSETLVTARNGMFYKAIGTTVTAMLALYVVGREFGWVDMIERVTFLMCISFPPILSIVTAIDWLRTVRRLDR